MSDEIAKAQTAKPTEDTIFGKIARKEIKVDLIHDDDQENQLLKMGISIDRLMKIDKVYPHSIASKLGLRDGDEVLGINEIRIHTPQELFQILNYLKE